MSINYGLTLEDLNYSIDHVSKQRDFMKENGFTTATGQFKTLLDISFAANHSERYYSQILNKVHTLNSYNLAIDYVPVFMTATLDAPFHEMLEGKHDKFFKKYDVQLETRKKKSGEVYFEIEEYVIYLNKTGEVIKHLVPNNDRYGYILEKILERKFLTVKDLYKILSFQMHGFQKSYIFKKIKKLGDEVSYLRVTEPMKSGVPHFHLLLYTNKLYIKELYNSFHKYFSAPQNSKPLTMKDNKRVCTKPLEDGTKETQGFQWDINSATGYVLKYVLKSFRNVKDNEEIDYLQAWYINHRIPRIITSHTLVPQWVYNKISPWYNDWYYLTDLKRNHNYTCNSEFNTFTFEDHDCNMSFDYDNGVLKVYHKDKLLKEVGTKKPNRKRINPTKLKYTDKKDKKPTNNLVPVYIDNVGQTLYVVKGLSYAKPYSYHKPISKMSTYELFNHRNDFDIDYAPLSRFINIENELIRRGEIEGEIHHSLNTNLDGFFDEFKEEVFDEYYI